MLAKLSSYTLVGIDAYNIDDTADGRRPVLGNVDLFQTNPQWRDHVPFHEYFHGDTGRGVGASHQTGWTGLVAKLLEQTATQTTAPRHVVADGQASSVPAVPSFERAAWDEIGRCTPRTQPQAGTVRRREMC